MHNPGAFFIVGFQILLLTSAGLLILDDPFWAEEVAVVAYSSLLIGVVLQLISFARARHEDEVERE